MKNELPIVVGLSTPWSRKAGTPDSVTRSILFLLILIFSSCAANTGRGPTITITDFRARNIERLHDGIPSLVGEDSAGLAARGYVRQFEEDLAMKIPTQGEPPMPVTTDPMPDNSDLGYRYSDPVEAYNERVKSLQGNNVSFDPKLLELKRWLDGKKIEAIGDLRTHNEAFAAGGGRTPAKMGLSAAYVAISCANEPGDVETITKLVEPLLTTLTTK